MQAQTAQTAAQFFVNAYEGGTTFVINVNAVFNTGGDGWWTTIKGDVTVNTISIFVSNDTYNGTYNDSDLAVNYNEATWDNDVNGLVYTDATFIKQVKQFLINNGFEAAAVNAITYSEQGMQDDGRISCDAYEFADYLRTLVK
jgi:hypothetical protein